ncbi:MAG: transcription-repair coupling factor [Clostridia bacterium]|nr:transcription-repair coupling factor [Clostridia bacterium]
MYPIIKKILENEEVGSIQENLDSKEVTSVSIGGLTDSTKAHMIYALTCRGQKSSVVVCSNIMQANRIMQDLRFFSQLEVIYFPAKNLEYYEIETQSAEIQNQRMVAIDKMLSNEKNIIVTTIDALLVKMQKIDHYKKKDIILKQDGTVNLTELVKSLVELGYEKTESVEGKGQFAVRGGIIDIFSLSNELPYRVELFGNEIDSIRTFDTITQRSIDKVEQFTISLLSEFTLTEERKDVIIHKLNELCNSNISQELRGNIEEDIEKIKNGDIKNIIDKYFKLMVEDTSDILDYLQEYNVFIDEFEKCSTKAINLNYENYETIKVLEERGYIYSQLVNQYIEFKEIETKLATRNIVYLDRIVTSKNHSTIKYDFDAREACFYRNSIDVLLYDIHKATDKSILLVFPSDNRVNQVKNYLLDHQVKVEVLENIDIKEEYQKGKVYIAKGILSTGFASELFGILLIAEPVSGISVIKHKKKKELQNGKVINSFEDLEIGDYVVHENHGIGIYRGIESVEINHVVNDYIKIEYANKGMLYVPINQLDNVKKYICDDEAKPKINSLNSKEWDKTKHKVNTHVREIAKELVLLYAKRENSVGFAFSKDTPWQKEFEDSFEYELTDDQKRSVKEIKEEMESGHIMDRLLCGDVGYGKTEVALRAAFKAVVSGKQVAYLVPTTVLSLQQWRTFSNRMEKFGVRVEMLNRFKSPKEQKNILKDLIDGKVDVVIGTHRILSKDVFFKDLGLLIVDEEHRFGVKAKESIKQLKDSIDVLSMTATPIPRTLHMSMIGVRTMSSLTEPPLERLPVHTYVLEYDENVVKEAIEKELLRDGQVIYLNNRIEGIEEIVERLRKLVPRARIGLAHGRMEPEQIENIMLSFINHDIDVMVCTTIFESGIDIPNANTLIVEDSDKLGLAQLYQIRGRVGRSNRLAYAYITYKKNKQLSEVSEKRLKAIRDFTEFGSGFKIALRDLEIRGAGNLLGREQHGHMARVGYEMYLSLLEKAIREEKAHGGNTENIQNVAIELRKEIKIDLNVSAYISDRYIKDPIQKISMYQKIADINDNEEIMDLIDELLDRYGDIPKETDNLLKIVEIRNLSRKLGINKITTNKDFVIFEPLNLKLRLTNKTSNDILINVQLELKKLEKEMEN